MRFRHKNSLIRHQCQHTGERRYQCQLCDFAFIAKHRLSEHMKRAHPTSTSWENEVERVTSTSPDVEIVCQEEKVKDVKPKGVQQQQKKAQLSPTLLGYPAAILQTGAAANPTLPIMSVVAGTDGQMYLIPQAQQPSYIVPSTTQPALLVASPTMVSGTPDQSWGSQQIQEKPVQSKQPSTIKELDFLELAAARVEKQQWADHTSGDIVASAMAASNLLSP